MCRNLKLIFRIILKHFLINLILKHFLIYRKIMLWNWFSISYFYILRFCAENCSKSLWWVVVVVETYCSVQLKTRPSWTISFNNLSYNLVVDILIKLSFISGKSDFWYLDNVFVHIITTLLLIFRQYCCQYLDNDIMDILIFLCFRSWQFYYWYLDNLLLISWWYCFWYLDNVLIDILTLDKVLLISWQCILLWWVSTIHAVYSSYLS